MTTTSNRERLSGNLVLDLPGFSRFCAIGRPELDAPATALAPPGIGASEWYQAFVNRVELAVASHQYLPVYRMGDGEYTMLVGPQGGLVGALRRMAARILRGRPAHRSGDPVYGFEEYTSAELRIARPLLAEHVAGIAAHGILALALHPLNPGFAKFIAPVLSALDRANVVLSEQNYVPFYYVYALLCGPDRRKFFAGRRVLAVTGDTPGKFAAIERGLLAIGVERVECLPCHPRKAMFAQLDVNAVKTRPDIILVGAGIGSANVLMQLRDFGTACIDAGYCLTVLSRPEVPRRAYALPDEEFDRFSLADIPNEIVRCASKS